MNDIVSTRADSPAAGRKTPHIDHEGGEHNVRVLGLDIRLPVFAISAILAVALVAVTLLFPGQAASAFAASANWTVTTFDWLFLGAANLFVVYCLVVALSPLGRVRLGGPEAVPDFGYSAWLAMLFAAGIGIGLMFFGVLEPVTHSLAPPLGIDPADTASSRAVGMAATVMHWGVHGWAIYAIASLSLAFFCFNRGMPLTLRSAFFPLVGDCIRGPFGHAVDIVAVLSTLFAVAVSLGLGAEQIAGGLQHLFGIPATAVSQIILIVAITGIATASVVAGLDRGIKRLSWINMGLAGLLWLFVLIAGPTLVILVTIGETIVHYLYYLPALSNWVDREDTAFLHGWTTFYWAWWVAWAPFVGMFIARISFGRTVREFVTWVLVVPTIIAVLWMATFGGTALDQYFSDGYTGVAESVPELALFRMLERLPMADVVSAVSVVLITIFFVTSADSGSLVMDTITAGGKLDVSARQRSFWCLLAGAAAMALMLGGGMVSMQALMLAVGLPLTLLLLCMCVGLTKAFIEELRRSASR